MKVNRIYFLFLFCLLLLATQNAKADDYVTESDISYISETETDAYRQERCKLDIYYPTDKKDFTTIVWFHGGGLEGGNKHFVDDLKEKGIAIVAVNYRLSPKATNPAYIVDAAESVAWIFKNIASYGGDLDKIYVAGHSAGGYLSLMIGFDKSYLAAYGIDADRIKGLIPISGQTVTHYTIRKERGLPDIIPLIDEYAPINQARKNIPPTLLITGDRKLELTARFEENLYLEAILKSLKGDVTLCELQGFDHGTVLDPAMDLLLRFIITSNSFVL